MNNRRSFLRNLAISAAAFSILPSAATYARHWKPAGIVPVRYEINPEWVNAPYEISFWWNDKAVMSDTGLLLQRKQYEPPLDKEHGIVWPSRFVLDGGNFKNVPAFIKE